MQKIKKVGEVVADKPNWIKIKNEYITTNISYRKISEKYKVSFNTLQIKAKKENWKSERDKTHDKIRTKTRQKTVEKIAEQQASYIVDIARLSFKLGAKIEQFVDADKITEAKDIKALTSSLKDIDGMQSKGTSTSDTENKIASILEVVKNVN